MDDVPKDFLYDTLTYLRMHYLDTVPIMFTISLYRSRFLN